MNEDCTTALTDKEGLTLLLRHSKGHYTYGIKRWQPTEMDLKSQFYEYKKVLAGYLMSYRSQMSVCVRGKGLADVHLDTYRGIRDKMASMPISEIKKELEYHHSKYDIFIKLLSSQLDQKATVLKALLSDMASSKERIQKIYTEMDGIRLDLDKRKKQQESMRKKMEQMNQDYKYFGEDTEWSLTAEVYIDAGKTADQHAMEAMMRELE